MNMATGGLDSFLRAEEEANRLVEELRRLKKEIESHKTAHEALSEASAAVSKLATRCAEIAERLGGLAETLRSIGTPELLHRLEEVARVMGVLRQDLDGTRQSVIEAHQRDMEQLKESLGVQIAGVTAAVRVVRNWALGSVVALVIALALLSWLALSLARG
jgi:chromosome segregation ATPase